ncbi:MAG: enoyl-CoA hydratase/isomerase family protein [Planctomycetales bacterium]
MTHPHVKSKIEGSFLFVCLNRPEKRNALTPEMLDAISAAVQMADDHPEVRAVIVHAEGPVFSAGIDILSLGTALGKESGANPGRQLRRLAARMQGALNALEATEVPIIGALQGQVIGLGLELALAFDLRVATEDCQLSIPEARMGMVADVGGTTRLVRTVGTSRAKDLLMTARTIEAQEALTWGLVNRVVPAGELLSSAVALAQQIAQNAPLAVGLAKRIVDQGSGLPAESQMSLERWAQSQLIDSEDLQEAARAFLEKRPPKFRGR